MLDKNAKNAIKIGSLCSVAYLAVYVARNLLGVITPKMIDSGIYTLEYIGTISTCNMLCYAFGQLFNGAIGDRIYPKYMISSGSVFSGVCNFLIPLWTSPQLTALFYSLSGFFLSMIYGPLTKTVSENVLPKYASRCALGYTFASFFGSPCAGVIAILFNYDMGFIVTAIVLMAMGLASFFFFNLYEKSGIIQYNKYSHPKDNRTGIKLLIKNEIIKYSFVSMITGIIRTSVVFWIPTYLKQRIGLSNEISALVFSMITIIMSLSPYINNLLVYERVFRRDRNKTLLFMFSLSAVSFSVMFVFKQPIVNIVFLCLALISNGGASTILYSVYCPSLCNTGMVSTATGYIDFLSYMSAAASNIVFSNAAGKIGWGNLVLVWCAIMVFGVIVALPYKKKKSP